MSLKIGDEILDGKYRIEKALGEGAFGKVYLADDVPLRRQVALKELRREDWTDEQYTEFRRRFQREARIGAALRHENIVEVHTLEPVGKDFYLVMEYVDGPSLQKRLEERGPLPIEEAVEIAMKLCEGLAAVHDHPLGIVHRDIKPSNILLTSQGQPKITDFGLAQLAAESGRSLGKGERHPGTPLYMSPEQETTAGYLRPASDIYSLGCVLFEMLTGKVYMKVEGSKASKWRPEVPEWLDKVLTEMLQVDWRSRYQEAGQTKSDLEEPRGRREATRAPVQAVEDTLAAQEVVPPTEASKAPPPHLDEIDPYGEMILIPAGDFIMGEAPEQRTVYVDDFFIAKYPVTNARYGAFIEAHGYSAREYWSPEGWKWRQETGSSQPRWWDDEDFNRPDQPVVGVTYYEAEAYCQWAGLRLPAEQEWEKAARGTDGRVYPWGNKWQEGRCNSDEAGIGHTTPVNRYRSGASPYGVMDMSGNVHEWTSGWWGSERQYRFLYGGSWYNPHEYVRCDERSGMSTSDNAGSWWLAGSIVGIRCAKSSPQPSVHCKLSPVVERLDGGAAPSRGG